MVLDLHLSIQIDLDSFEKPVLGNFVLGRFGRFLEIHAKALKLFFSMINKRQFWKRLGKGFV